MKYIKNNSVNPCFNLALEEYVHRSLKDGDYLLLWQNHNTVVIGKNQNALEEIDPAGVKENGVTVVRRNTGGGAVYHDMGNLNFSFITDWAIDGDNSFPRFAAPVIEALKSFGVAAEVSGRNDILVDEKKISGNAQHIHDGRILHHGTLLVSSNLSVMPKVLKVKPSKIQSKGVKSVRSRVTNIQDCTRMAVTVDALKEALIQACSQKGPLEEVVLTSDQLDAIHQLAKSKYESDLWTYGRSPAATFINAARFPGGELSVSLEVKGNTINGCSFSGDFLSAKNVEDVAAALTGLPWEISRIEAALNRFPLQLYFGSITLEEILSLFV